MKILTEKTLVISSLFLFLLVGDPELGKVAKVKSLKMLAHFGLFCFLPFLKQARINSVDPPFGMISK